MTTAWLLLILLASLTVWQSTADDPCDSEECLPATEPVCAVNVETDNMVLFADECVLRCTNCRMTAEFKKVNSSFCSTGTTSISVCPDFPLGHGNEKTEAADPDDEIMVVGIDIGPGDSIDYDGVPPFFSDSLPLPLPLLSMGSEMLRRLVMSNQPDQPPHLSMGSEMLRPLLMSSQPDQLPQLSMGSEMLRHLVMSSQPDPPPLLSVGSEMLRRLLMPSQPDLPPLPPEGVALLKADIKVDVTINMGRPPQPPPPPPPPASRVAAPPPLAMLPPQMMYVVPRAPLVAAPPPPPPPPPPQYVHLQFESPEPEAYSAASREARPAISAAIASLVALTVAALHF